MDKGEARARLIALAENTAKGAQRDALIMGATALMDDVMVTWLEKHDERIRADEREKVLNEVKGLIETRLVDNFALSDATKYGNITAEQQANSYATVMKYEIADCVDDLLDDLKQLKAHK